MNYLLLNPVNWASVFTVLGIAAGLAVIFALLILIVSKFSHVEEDTTVIAVSENLAGANCGGCGYAGCEGFAKALCEGKASLSDCGATSNEGKAKIAQILNLEFTASEEVYAVVACAGGENAKEKYSYVGNDGCTAQSAYLGGKKCCPQGCIGEGTCESLCPFNAITVTNGVAHVEKALCVACGVCVRNCPKKLVRLIPKSSKVYVACSTTCRGKDVMNNCTAGCIGCGLCAKNCPENAITMIDNLPVIDYSKCSGCLTCVAKCPRKCIREI